MSKRNALLWLSLMLLLAFASAVGQSPADDESDEDDDTPAASLAIHFGSGTDARVDFNLPAVPASWANIKPILAQSLHCPVERFTTPPVYQPKYQDFVGWTPEQRDQYQKFLVEYSERSLVADCPSILAQGKFLRQTDIDVRNLSAELKLSGAELLWVNISFPESQVADSSRQFLLRPHPDSRGGGDANHLGAARFINYRIPISELNTLPPLHFEYGLRPSSLAANLLILLAMVVLPLAVTVWMRSAILRTGTEDPTAAWFSYSRTLNWCINGASLLWIVSGLGARQWFEEWVRFQNFSYVPTSLLDVLVVVGPAFLLSFACIAVSYPVHIRLRSKNWSRREYMFRQSVNVGAVAFPLMFFLAALANIGTNGQPAAILFALGAVSWFACQSLRLRLNQTYPQALTTGELRDRIFELAKRAGVSITQIYVISAGKEQIANAYAMKSRTVMFTDYLLQHLTKREVDGVAAHELAHLQRKHVPKRVAAFYGAFLLPGLMNGFLRGLLEVPLRRLAPTNLVLAQLVSSLNWFWNWSQRDLVTLVAGFSFFYFLSRRFEHEADEGAVAISGDAEAQITGLLKLSRLNLMPIQWGKATGAWLSHPTTLKRAQRIAASAGMSAEQLQSVLQRYEAERHAGVKQSLSAGDHYSVPLDTGEKAVKEVSRKRRVHQLRFWLALFAHITPAAVAVECINLSRLSESRALPMYAAALLLTPVFATLLDAWYLARSRKAHRARLLGLLDPDGKLDARHQALTGFSPGPAPRFYGINSYDWDVGFLNVARDRISFLGEQTRFSIPREQVDAACLGPGGPSWWKVLRTYMRIHDSGGEVVFSLSALEPCSIWQVRSQNCDLHDRVHAWLYDEDQQWPEARESWQFPPLALGQVTSISPRRFGKLKTNLRVFAYLIPLALVVSTIFRLDAFAYLFSAAFFTRLVESIPYWRFHDPLLSFGSDGNRKSRAVAGSES